MMRFVTVREFRQKAAEVWKEVSSGTEVVLTSQGKPIALVTAVSGEDLERQVRAIRRARAQIALERCWEAARKAGDSGLPIREIERRIQDLRRSRKTRAKGRS